MEPYIKQFSFPQFDNKRGYPYSVLAPKKLRTLSFEPITIMYGSNGCGKSTLLNIIARKLGIEMIDRGNDSQYLQEVIDKCKYISSAPFKEHCDVPEGSRFIRSEEVMHTIVRIRKRNEMVKQHVRSVNPELYEKFFISNNGNIGYVWSDEQWIYSALENFDDSRSNGEMAFEYFQDHIGYECLVILDEPENSLSPKFQKKLSEMILDYARYFKTQFIIATHSPFLLSIPDSRIYNLDLSPAKIDRFENLESTKIYKELFDKVKIESSKSTKTLKQRLEEGDYMTMEELQEKVMNRIDEIYKQKNQTEI